MIQIEQTKVSGLGGGNCQAACIASIFEVEIESVTVPCGGNYQAVCEWTAREYPGLHPINRDWNGTSPDIPVEDVEWPEPFKSYWIATVASPRTLGHHCVVMHGSEMVWDPHPQREMGFGLCVGSMWWMVRDPAKLFRWDA